MKQRLHYFDMLKGLAIFMVVMGHVIAFCIPGGGEPSINRLLGHLRMPLFFFISGWMSGGCRHGVGILGRRLMQLIVPMVVCSTLWLLFLPYCPLGFDMAPTLEGLWMSATKYGYWFTVSLFEMICIVTLSGVFLSKNISLPRDCAVAAVLALLCYIALASSDVSVRNALSFKYTAVYMPVYLFGLVARRHEQTFHRLIANRLLQAGIIAVFVLSLHLVVGRQQSGIDGLAYSCVRTMLHISFGTTAVILIRPWSERAFAHGEQPRPLASMWAYLGRNSFAIYLLHFFLLFPMPFAGRLADLGFPSWLTEVVLGAPAAMLIIAAVLAFCTIVRHSALLSWTLCGRFPSGFGNLQVLPKLSAVRQRMSSILAPLNLRQR